IGNFDLILVHYSLDFEREDVIQFGTVERDGTDEWAEKNLFITESDGQILLAGLTLGSLEDSVNQGGSDVFLWMLE
ncbi:MAG: hypothetical protein KC496_17870, partial [Anaerolineae bacterium]|nr:hypothetical protein [Anaerolineae bacterium]